MYCKKPVVATNVDAIPEIIDDGYSGILVNMDDYESAAVAVIKLIESQETRSALSENAFKDVRTWYDEKRVVTQTERLIFLLRNYK